MLLFRSLTTGLLGACVLLLVELSMPPPHVSAAPPIDPVEDHVFVAMEYVQTTSATIVDVSPAIRAADLAALVQLAPDEHVVSIDDRVVANDLDAGARLAAGGAGSGRYVDVTVSSPSSTRRVLLLMH
jgi:hypothetical protein